MDEHNPVLPEDNPYVQRLRKLTVGITDADGIPLNFKVYHVTDINAFACPDGSVRVFSSLMDIMNDDEIEIVIEVMGGIEPARTMILEALHAGKNVVTANKDLVATHGHELLEAAVESGVEFLFEASVAGAIPIIRPLKQCLAANEIQEVIGIVNGTTNFILT